MGGFVLIKCHMKTNGKFCVTYLHSIYLKYNVVYGYCEKESNCIKNLFVLDDFSKHNKGCLFSYTVSRSFLNFLISK